MESKPDLEATVAIAVRVRASQAARLASEGMTSEVLKRIIAEYTGIPSQEPRKPPGWPKGKPRKKLAK